MFNGAIEIEEEKLYDLIYQHTLIAIKT